MCKKLENEFLPVHPIKFISFLLFLLALVFFLFYILNASFKNIKNFEIIISFLLGIMSLTFVDVLKKQWFAPSLKITSWDDAQELRRRLTDKEGEDKERYDYILKIENDGNSIAKNCELSISIKNFSKENVWPSGAMIRNSSEWMPISNEAIPWTFLARGDLPRKIDINPRSSIRIAFLRQEGADSNGFYKISSPNQKMQLVYLRYHNEEGEKINYKINVHISGENFLPITKECELK
jgi:hypothetical protein